jgi:hypothetical protein
MKMFAYGTALAACCAVGAAAAADFDGSKALICATVEAMDCASGSECVKGRAAQLGAPPFMRIDFEQKTIAGPRRTTPIAAMDKTDGQVLLQGREVGYGWTLALDAVDGSMSATLVNREGAFVLFGQCTPL